MTIALDLPQIDTGFFNFGSKIIEAESIDHLPWDEWLLTLFPHAFEYPFAPHHIDFWHHIDSIRRGVKPSPYLLILARKGGKSSSLEKAAVRLGAKEHRKFGLYIRATQNMANKSVQNIAGLLESATVEKHYPKLATRHMSKYGHSRGWKMDLLRCGNGFNVAALGLDAAVRSLKLDEFRPDFFMIDDIDDPQDSPETIEKKIETLTRDILPAGSDDAAVIGSQNLMHPQSIFKLLVDNKADFLGDRIINGPHPAIIDLAYEAYEDNDRRKYRITNGTPTWGGQSIETSERQMTEWGKTAFLIEAQHEVDLVEGGIYESIDHIHCNFDEVPELIAISTAVDPAVTDNDNSDCQAIQIDGLAVNDKIYRLFSFEGRSSPSEIMVQAIVKTIEYGGDTIIFETDQGGDLWEESYEKTWEDLIEDDDYPAITWETIQPDFIAARAGSIGSKKHRGQLQLREYERGRFVHVRGTSHVLEKALGRFPKRKPFDLHDAGFWSSYYLIEDAPYSA